MVGSYFHNQQHNGSSTAGVHIPLGADFELAPPIDCVCGRRDAGLGRAVNHRSAPSSDQMFISLMDFRVDRVRV
jgi:hypothetical protein